MRSTKTFQIFVFRNTTPVGNSHFYRDDFLFSDLFKT